MKTFSLTEAAAEICGPDLKNPEVWLARQIRAGRIRAHKIGRSWRMTREQIDAAFDTFSNTPATPQPQPEPQPHGGLTLASAARRRVS